MFKKSLMVVMLAMVCALFSLPVFAGELDGTQWKMKQKGWRGIVMFWKSDMLTFENGEFKSDGCVPLGIGPGPYDSTKSGGSVVWSAKHANDKGEKMEWEGTLSGERLTGSIVWTKENGKSKRYLWKAKKVS